MLPFRNPAAPLAGMALFALVGALLLARLERFHPHPSFGLGNIVTVVRAGGTAVFAAIALEPAMIAGPHGWTALAAAAILLALDGIDGLAARRQGLVSRFGARLDMEVDTLLILVLAAVAFGLGKVGPWILALGTMRYAFVIAGVFAPALTRPLPPSSRRRTVCALQVAVLGLLLAPPVGLVFASALAAVAVAGLAASFAVDIAGLLRSAR